MSGSVVLFNCVRSSMDRAPDFGSDGWGFESLRAHAYVKCTAGSAEESGEERTALRGGSLLSRSACAARRLGHALHHLLDVLAAPRPRRLLARLAGCLTAHGSSIRRAASRCVRFNIPVGVYGIPVTRQSGSATYLAVGRLKHGDRLAHAPSISSRTAESSRSPREGNERRSADDIGHIEDLVPAQR